jgi:hypothetical protein
LVSWNEFSGNAVGSNARQDRQSPRLAGKTEKESASADQNESVTQLIAGSAAHMTLAEQMSEFGSKAESIYSH